MPPDRTDRVARRCACADQERPEGQLWLGAGAAVFLLFALLPIAALVATAIPAEPVRKLADPAVRAALRLSIITSLVATGLAALLGIPVAYLLARFRFRGRALLDTLVDLPMVLPPVVAGVALLLAYGRTGLVGRHLAVAGVRLPFSTLAVVVAQTFMASPFFIRAARSGFAAVPRSLEQAAMTLGRDRWSVFWTVSVPLAAPGLAAGLVLAWARALSEFGATMVFAGNLPGVTQTLPLAVLSALESTDGLATAAAISALSLILAFGALAGARRFAR